MDFSKNNLNDIAEYYSNRISTHGVTPKGVDWNSEAGQVIRFQQLSKLLDQKETDFSLMDLGCGYGAYFSYLHKNYLNFSYLGIDVSEKMIEAAIDLNSQFDNSRFEIGNAPNIVTDFSVASGIFNVRLTRSDSEWQDYLKLSLNMLNKSSKLGFAFNCLTKYSDTEKKKDYLFYADPCWVFDYCKRNYSNQVALLHDYGLYEFTIIVRKEK